MAQHDAETMQSKHWHERYVLELIVRLWSDTWAHQESLFVSVKDFTHHMLCGQTSNDSARSEYL